MSISNDVETVALQTLVGHQSGAERTNADYHGAVFAVKAEEILQSPLELLHVIAYAGLALDVEHREILGYLGGVDVYFLGYGSGGDMFHIMRLEHRHVGQIPRQAAQSRFGCRIPA